MPELFKTTLRPILAVNTKVRLVSVVVTPVLTLFIGRAQSIVCIINVQHNCYDGRCAATGRRYARQERVLTEIEELYIEHTDDTRYLINTHALHNAAIVRKILPRNLTAPVPYLNPAQRESEHHKMAAILRAAQDKRRTKEAAARRERRDAAAAAKSTTAGVVPTAVEEAIDRASGHGVEEQPASQNQPGRPNPRKRSRRNTTRGEVAQGEEARSEGS